MPNDPVYQQLLITTLINTVLLGAAAGMVGMFLSTKKTEISVNVASGAAFTGILILGFALGIGSSLTLTIFAAVFCLFLLVAVNFIIKTAKLNQFAVTSVTFSVLLGLCFALLTFFGTKDSQLANEFGRFVLGDSVVILKHETETALYIYIASILTMLLGIKSFKYTLFSVQMAKTSKIHTGIFTALIFIITSAVASLGIQIMGVLFLGFLFTAPAVMARTLTKSFTPAVILSGFIGSLSCFAGGIISGFNNHIPTGAATTVILAVPLLFLAYFSSKKIKDNSK